MGKTILLIITLIFIFLYLTNPSTTEFIEYAKDYIKNEASYVIPSGSFITGVVYGLTSNYVDPMIENIVNREDYYIFSIYSINIFGEDIEVLGILDKFFILNNP